MSLDVTYRGMPSSAHLTELGTASLAKLSESHPTVESARMVVEHPSAHHKQGGSYRVALHLQTAAGPLDVEGEATDVTAAMDAAFANAARRVEGEGKEKREEKRREARDEKAARNAGDEE
ncbi:hypothetical protein DFJ74DRAFT_708369 [Hyaloraphidium curvatum]|nr:hypothetical protein DFJ74DRAFT_708369 [Hyaloraphidium curvatum]